MNVVQAEREARRIERRRERRGARQEARQAVETYCVDREAERVAQEAEWAEMNRLIYEDLHEQYLRDREGRLRKDDNLYWYDYDGGEAYRV